MTDNVLIQILGIVLLVGGLLTLLVALQDHFGQPEPTRRGSIRFSQRTWALLIGGGGGALIGVLLLVV